MGFGAGAKWRHMVNPVEVVAPWMRATVRCRHASLIPRGRASAEAGPEGEGWRGPRVRPPLLTRHLDARKGKVCAKQLMGASRHTRGLVWSAKEVEVNCNVFNAIAR